MGSWRKMGAFLGLVARDDEVEGADYDGNYSSTYGEEYRDEYASSGYDAPRGGRSSSHRGDDGSSRASVGGADPVTRGALAVQLYPEERRATESSGGVRPLTVKLTGFAEARLIGEHYRDGASVILDMTQLTDSDARRVVDFAAGLAFAMHGSIDKVTARVFMLLPPHTDLSAEERRSMAAGAFRRG